MGSLIETVKTNSKLYEEKLNIVIGKIKEVSFNDHYIFLELDDSKSLFSLKLYLDRFYDPDFLFRLKSQRTTGLVAKKHGRKFIGIELNPGGIVDLGQYLGHKKVKYQADCLRMRNSTA